MGHDIKIIRAKDPLQMANASMSAQKFENSLETSISKSVLSPLTVKLKDREVELQFFSILHL